jgi:hypothetical protein
VILKIAIALVLAGLAWWIFVRGDPEDNSNDYP